MSGKQQSPSALPRRRAKGSRKKITLKQGADNQNKNNKIANCVCI